MSTVDRCAEPAATPGRRPVADAEWMAGLGALGVAVAAVVSPDHVEDGPVLCPFRLLSGLPCPGCGLTRSWVYAVHGRWEDSFLAHPFGLLTIAVVLGLAVVTARARLGRGDVPSLQRLVRHRVVRVVLVAWAGFAVARLLWVGLVRVGLV